MGSPQLSPASCPAPWGCWLHVCLGPFPSDPTVKAPAHPDLPSRGLSFLPHPPRPSPAPPRLSQPLQGPWLTRWAPRHRSARVTSSPPSKVGTDERNARRTPGLWIWGGLAGAQLSVRGRWWELRSWERSSWLKDGRAVKEGSWQNSQQAALLDMRKDPAEVFF